MVGIGNDFVKAYPWKQRYQPKVLHKCYLKAFNYLSGYFSGLFYV